MKLKATAAAPAFSAALLLATLAHANHPVLVEGNCPLPTSRTNVASGTCGDHDGDGLIGTAEDTDGDRVFGTITAALAAASGGANQNGRVTIVTSGIFAETVTVTGASGNVTIEAAPGVDANIDAVLAGDGGNAARQAAAGIIVNSPASRIVTLRNLVSRNWTDGIQVLGDSRVLIADCRVEQNTNYGIHVLGNSRVSIRDTEVSGTGYRVGMTGSFPDVNLPDPGIGISFEKDAEGSIVNSHVHASFADAIERKGAKVKLFHVTTSDNGKD